LGIDEVWIEVVRDPLFEVGVTFVLGVVERVEELGIDPRAADVLGRAASRNLDEARIKDTWFGIDEALDFGPFSLGRLSSDSIALPAYAAPAYRHAAIWMRKRSL
jgi:hypothetical protein